jgi:hypothetical protein
MVGSYLTETIGETTTLVQSSAGPQPYPLVRPALTVLAGYSVF